MDGDDYGRLAYLLLLLMAVSGWVFVEYKGRMGFAMRSAMAWVMIFVGVAAGYGLWTDMQDRAAPMQSVEAGTVALPRAFDGHYYATLTINGVEMEFLVDTGATQMVLSLGDAERLGIDPASLLFLGEAQTANGVVRTARVVLPVVEFGPFRDTDVVAFVSEGEMEGSLLGMSYLGQYRIEIAGREMILRRGN
ncbi:MAG: retropepsin-like aspartic protease family protein [Paracoccaceae bacterium]